MHGKPFTSGRHVLTMFFEWAPILIAACGFMPPPDLIFAELPAEIDDASVTQMGKVAEPDIHVLDEHAEFVNGLQVRTNLLQARDIQMTDRTATAILSLRAGFLNFPLRLNQDGLGLLDRSKPRIKLRNQVIGFGDSECAFVFFAVRHAGPRCVLPLAHPSSGLQPTEPIERTVCPRWWGQISLFTASAAREFFRL